MNTLYFGNCLHTLREQIKDESVDLNYLVRSITPFNIETVTAGFHEFPHHGKFPRSQILTTAGLLNRTEPPEYPDMAKGSHTSKKAKKEAKWEVTQ